MGAESPACGYTARGAIVTPMKWELELLGLCALLSGCERATGNNQNDAALPSQAAYVQLGPFSGLMPAPDASTAADAGVSSESDETGRTSADSGVGTLPPAARSSTIQDAGQPRPLEDADPSPPISGDSGAAAAARLPAELLEHEQYLEEADFAPCDQLRWAVDDCCARGAAFVCPTRTTCNCEGVFGSYPGIGQLCTIEPPTPLRWECAQ